MFDATLNGKTFFTTELDADEYTLTKARINKTANAAGSFSFTIPPCNLAYNNFRELVDYVDVHRGEQLLFSGRVYNIQQQFDGQLAVICEGLFAILNDSIIRPFTHENASVEHLVQELVNQHNGQVNEDKRIKKVSVSIDDKDFIAYRAYENHETTMTRMLDLVSSFGGYMDIVRTEEGLELTWVQNYTDAAMQSIDFGENLLDLTQTVDASEIMTALIPLGASIEDEDGMVLNERLTIATVNPGGSDIIYASDEAIARYGLIVKTNIWDDVTVPSVLLSKGRAYLAEKSSGTITIKATAVDLADAGYSVEGFCVGQLIRVVSEPHGLLYDDNRWFECTSQILDLLYPATNKLVLGSTVTGYIRDTMNKSASQAKEGRIYADYKANETAKSVREGLEQRISTYESIIEQMPDQIRASVLETVSNQYDERIGTVESQAKLASDSLAIWFGENGKINTWFEFDENEFKIRKNGQSVYSVQDNNSYEFKDASGSTLMELNQDGMTAPTVNVSGQLKVMSGETDQWAIRKGAYINGIGVNLDDVWIGG